MVQLLLVGKLCLNPAGKVPEQCPVILAEAPRLGVQQAQGSDVLSARSLQGCPA
ncbi:hypothetical protein [Nesterenkonia pannonica]|uniref:hypothetical protein n=1 Tax=Nesterenkonia pannonica TaxID=1548602 RepID=UPI002164D585|nr:hypothetical protein [Nesterenkonia pannonica]